MGVPPGLGPPRWGQGPSPFGFPPAGLPHRLRWRLGAWEARRVGPRWAATAGLANRQVGRGCRYLGPNRPLPCSLLLGVVEGPGDRRCAPGSAPPPPPAPAPAVRQPWRPATHRVPGLPPGAAAAGKLRRLRVRGEISAFTCIRHSTAPLVLYAARATRFGAPLTPRNRSFRSPQPACTAACGVCAGRGTGRPTKCGHCWAGSAG